MILLVGRAFWQWFSHENGIFIFGISVKESFLVLPSAVWGHSVRKHIIYEPGSSLVSLDTKSAGIFFFKGEHHLILNSKQNSIYNVINKTSLSFLTVTLKNKASDLSRIYI